MQKTITFALVCFVVAAGARPASAQPRPTMRGP